MTKDRPIYALTWTIPDDFGGLTNVLFHRSTAFARAGRHVEILTLAPGLDVKARSAELRAAGYLSEGIRLRNMWDELAELSMFGLRDLAKRGRRPSGEPPRPVDAGSTRSSDAGKVIQTDRHRHGGTTLVTDEAAGSRGAGSKRRLTLWNRRGKPLAEWDSARGLYFAWLDHVVAGRPADLINDSQFVGGFLGDYRRANVTVAQVIHNSHLDLNAASPRGRLSKGKAEMLKNLDSFDLVAALTPRQAADLRAANLAGDNLVAIPNSRDIDIPRAEAEPDPRHGVVVARLTGQKRLDHAIEAVALARESTPGLRLDVYGDGPNRDSLQALIDKRGCAEAVELRGYRQGAAEFFRSASFSVLSSRFEGMGLVLVESMAAGCLPIAYDIRYGPSDIITDGVDGFLVPDGDIEALGAAIARAAALDPGTLATMRESAIRRAADYGDEAVTRQWCEELDRARRSPREKPATKTRASVASVRFDKDGAAVVGRVAPAGSSGGFLTWIARHEPIYGRSSVTVSEDGDFSGEIPFATIDSLGTGALDLYVDLLDGRSRRRLRLATGETAAAEGHGWETYSTMHGNISLRRSRSDGDISGAQ